MLTELTILAVTYIGVFVGSYLYRIAGQEVVDGEKELFLFQKILSWTIAAVFVLTIPTTTANKLIAAAVVLVIGAYYHNHYNLSAALVGLHPTFLISSLVFLYGFPKGSLLHKRVFSTVFERTWQFLVFGLIGLFLRQILFI